MADGETVESDYVVLNADFAYAMNNLVARERLQEVDAGRSREEAPLLFHIHALPGRRPSGMTSLTTTFSSVTTTAGTSTRLPKSRYFLMIPSIYIQNPCVPWNPELGARGPRGHLHSRARAQPRGPRWIGRPARRSSGRRSSNSPKRGAVSRICANTSGRRRWSTPGNWETDYNVYRGGHVQSGAQLPATPHLPAAQPFRGHCQLFSRWRGGTHPGQRAAHHLRIRADLCGPDLEEGQKDMSNRRSSSLVEAMPDWRS